MLGLLVILIQKVGKMFMLRLVSILTVLLWVPCVVTAMVFSTINWRGQDALLAMGPIIMGDKERLADALENLTPFPHGVPVVLLDSPGGSVKAALDISKMLEEIPVHMVIPDGASCASACASILFIAGKYRTVDPGGLFGQHSCSIDGVASENCNNIISEHALAHGVSYGSVSAFITYTPPQDILWFSREDVDCWGISHYPYTVESGFEKSEPCVFPMLGKNFPPAQSAWRLDFMSDGYRAFLRPAADHMRELELSLFCDEIQPGRLFISMDILGPSTNVGNAITSATLEAAPIARRNTDFTVSQFDTNYSRVVIEIPEADVLSFLIETHALALIFATRPPYETIRANSNISTSRKVLIFAANNCLNQ